MLGRILGAFVALVAAVWIFGAMSEGSWRCEGMRDDAIFHAWFEAKKRLARPASAHVDFERTEASLLSAAPCQWRVKGRGVTASAAGAETPIWFSGVVSFRNRRDVRVDGLTVSDVMGNTR